MVTIGNFDGVHLGHQALIAEATRLALPLGAPVCAYTFDPSPRDVMVPGHGIPAVQSLEDRIRCLGDAGAAMVVLETFTKDFSRIEARDYALDILGRRLRARGVVVGWDFRFGRGRQGDADLLRELLGVPVVQVEPVRLGGEVVSSTRVRELVRAGRVAEAAGMLGRPHVVKGGVVRGDARGRELGFPTANVAPASELVPPSGVYAVRADVGDGVWRPGVANLGNRPTFGPGKGPLEVHLLDFSGDLYEHTLSVGFVERIRAERAFDGLPALVEQIGRDVIAARAALVAP